MTGRQGSGSTIERRGSCHVMRVLETINAKLGNLDADLILVFDLLISLIFVCAAQSFPGA